MNVTYQASPVKDVAAVVSDAEWYEDWDSAVVRCEDGVPVECIGTDGGEPEDQTIRRDWAWIAPALQAAYDLGYEHGRHGQSEATT